MNKAKYITNPFLYLILIMLPVVIGIIIIFFKEYYASMICFIIAILFSLPYICLRKYFFSKMLINDEGITKLYRNEILKKLKWEDIVVAQAVTTPHGGQITFSDKPLFEGKEKWKNWKEIFVNMNSKFALELYKYKNKILVPIKDLEVLSQYVQDKLK